MDPTLRFPLRSAFLAIPLEGEAKSEFQRLQNVMHDYGDILSLQSPESPHITLQFWKELLEIEYNQVIAQADKIAAASSRFLLKAEDIATFGNRGEDRVVFIEIPFSEDLARLKKRCPWPSLQPFHPHLTLARVTHPQKFAVVKKHIAKLLGRPSLRIPVDRMRLYGEIKGVKQVPLLDFPFASQRRS